MSALLAGGLATLARLASGTAVRWVDCRPEPTQRIYFANHTSHLDFLVLWSVLPGKLRASTRPVAAQDYWEASRLRRYLGRRVFNAVLVARGGGTVTHVRAQLDRMTAALDEGYSLILFPEGTRGAGPEMGPFKSGLYYLAHQRPNIELIPVHLDNLHRIMPKGEFLLVPLLNRVSFGPPIHLREGEGKGAFLARARDAIARLQPS